ncbi:MAG: glycoside hydrolase family protein [Alphaproteobacteria bacterium]|nr:glycoside hydrolase family protein [Alphaproteobacteria bacterium]
MKISDQKKLEINELMTRFILHEGCKLMPYKCPAGYWTIGVGRNLETNPPTSEELKIIGDYEHGITKNAALFLLRHDIERVEKECKKNIPFFSALDDERQYALLDMAFNLGIKGLLKFRRMLKAMREEDWEKAAFECLNSMYAKQTGKRAKRIANTIKTGRFEI